MKIQNLKLSFIVALMVACFSITAQAKTPGLVLKADTSKMSKDKMSKKKMDKMSKKKMDKMKKDTSGKM